MAKKTKPVENQDTFEKRWKANKDNFRDRWADALYKISARVCVPARFSAYHYDAEGLPVDNLDEVAVEGKVYFFQTYDPEQDDEGGGKNYTSRVVKNPTWLELTNLVNEMIATTHDDTYVHLVDILVISTKNGIKKARFIMGSALGS